MGDVIDLIIARDARHARGGSHPLTRGALRAEVVRIRHGAYARHVDWDDAVGRDRQLALAAATRHAARGEPVFSHETAAALHGIPMLGRWPQRARVTVGPGGGVSNRSVERLRRALDPGDVVELPSGMRATSPLRTALDLATTRTELAGIFALSHVRRLGVGADELAAGLRRLGGVPGIRQARRAAARSVEGSESALETLVVVRCQDLGFEPPEQQAEIRGVDGVRYRVDFAWRGRRILGEADGKQKFRVDPGATRTPREALWAEKRREDALRARCDAFVRVAWQDAWQGDGLEARLVAAGVPRIGFPALRLTA